MRAAVLAALWVVGASPALADPPSGEGQVQASGETQGTAQTPSQRRPRMRCVSERPTESYISRRTCYTEEEWAERQRAAQETQRQVLDQRAACTAAGAGRAC